MAMKIYVNVGTADTAFTVPSADWVEMDLINDKLIFSGGLTDGQATPSPSELNSAAILVSTTADVEVSKFYLLDNSAAIIKQIHNMGYQNKRYVMCVSFDAATASEPVLEMWDNSSLNTVAYYSLGEGTANNSWFRGITTTAGAPGATWTGSRLAGSSTNHFLWLNNESGALSGATNLYFNLRITVPQSYTRSVSETPVMAVKYTTN